MRFRSVEDLDQAILQGIPSLPDGLDLVVGVPRSGLLVGGAIATHLDLPFTDVEGLSDRRLLFRPHRAPETTADTVFRRARRVLVVDDSVGHGSQIRLLRQQLREAGQHYDLHFAVAYATPEGSGLVDLAFETLPWGRCFGWNVFHHPFLLDCCIDLEYLMGVDLTADPDATMASQPPLVPSVVVGWLVSGQPEERRPVVEAWAGRHGLRHRTLLMRPDGHPGASPDGSCFKAEAYRAAAARLYVTGDLRQARRIAVAAGSSVLAIDAQAMVHPPLRARVTTLVQHPGSLVRKLWPKARRLERRWRHGAARAVAGERRP